MGRKAFRFTLGKPVSPSFESACRTARRCNRLHIHGCFVSLYHWRLNALGMANRHGSH
jgi:hypothetical protein